MQFNFEIVHRSRKYQDETDTMSRLSQIAPKVDNKHADADAEISSYSTVAEINEYNDAPKPNEEVF